MRTHGGGSSTLGEGGTAMPFPTNELSAIQKSADGRQYSEIENTGGGGCSAHLYVSLGLLQVTSDVAGAHIA